VPLLEKRIGVGCNQKNYERETCYASAITDFLRNWR
jgi:hypothetical protein